MTRRYNSKRAQSSRPVKNPLIEEFCSDVRDAGGEFDIRIVRQAMVPALILAAETGDLRAVTVRRGINAWIIALRAGLPVCCAICDTDLDDAPLVFAVALACRPDPSVPIVCAVCDTCDPHDEIELLRRVTSEVTRQIPGAKQLDLLHYVEAGGRA